ncbi:uncharacterized protein LOC122644833 [Telopea speciosissima]|uniref:uncharacterized protein LOC122644833 n=1 Tax=Telopea speciosissima TaxID=54955 RepID=UPI001CC35796|nr:uncharacterized protein LOC122644833 [Telopea speciosissima]
MFASFLRGRFVVTDGSLKRSVISSSILPGLQKGWEFVNSTERWVIDDGGSINFWYDRWLTGQRSCDLLPPGVTLPRNLKAKVADFIESGEWVLPSVTSSELWDICNQIMRTRLPSSRYEDARDWVLTESGSFSVVSAWDTMHVSSQHQGYFPTNEKIAKRSIPIASRCELCLKSQETINHIFLECDFAGQVWTTVLSLFDQRWNGFPSIEELFSWWKRKKAGVILPKVWPALVILMPYQIWMERNRRRYENMHRNTTIIIKSVLKELHEFLSIVSVHVSFVAELLLSRKLTIKISRSLIQKIIDVV